MFLDHSHYHSTTTQSTRTASSTSLRTGEIDTSTTHSDTNTTKGGNSNSSLPSNNDLHISDNSTEESKELLSSDKSSSSSPPSSSKDISVTCDKGSNTSSTNNSVDDASISTPSITNQEKSIISTGSANVAPVDEYESVLSHFFVTIFSLSHPLSSHLKKLFLLYVLLPPHT